MVRDLEPLGALESAVMEIVWRQFPATARDVCGRMRGGKARAYTTIMTTMDRLHRKGILLREKDGLAWSYRPAFSAAQFSKALADSLAGQILSADRDIALSAFVDATASVDKALLDRLRQLIDKRKRRPR